MKTILQPQKTNEFNHWGSFSTQGSGPDPSLGFQGQYFLANSDFGSVRSDRAGIGTYEVWKFRSTTSNLISNSESTPCYGPVRHFGPSRNAEQGRHLVHKYRSEPKPTRYALKCCVTSEFDIRLDVAHRNHALENQTYQNFQPSQVPIPDRSAQIELKSELARNL